MQDHVKLANALRIACTMRTLKPYYVQDGFTPWIHQNEAAQALIYLAQRTGFAKTPVLKELLEELSSFIKEESASQDPHPDVIAVTDAL